MTTPPLTNSKFLCCLKSEYSDYVEKLPKGIQRHLTKVLDWDHKGINEDLNKIADLMGDSWEEIFSSSLPFILIGDLEKQYQAKPPKMLR